MFSARVTRKQYIKNYPATFRKVQTAFLNDAVTILTGETKARCPRDKGRLKSSIAGRVDGGKAIVGTNVDYAPYIEYGTTPHMITVNGPVKIKGKWVYLKTVKHPGTKAQPFLRKALDANKNKLRALYDKIFVRYFSGR